MRMQLALTNGHASGGHSSPAVGASTDVPLVEQGRTRVH